jgi:transcriptional regulator with GAF, ATPase, and Fis domain
LEFILPREDDHNGSKRDKDIGALVDVTIAVVADAEIRRRERQNTLLALERCGWKIYGTGGAAQLLGIKPTTLSFSIKKWDLKSQRK